MTRRNRDSFCSFERLGARGFVNGTGAFLAHLDQRGASAFFEDFIGREDVQAVDQLLRDHAGDGDHRQAAVVDFLQSRFGHVFSGLVVGQAERVKAPLARDVVVVQGEQLAGERIRPAFLDASGFQQEDGGANQAPNQSRGLLEVVDGRTGDLRVEQERGAFNLLTNQETDGGNHGNAAVSNLRFAETLQVAAVDAFAKTEDVQAFRERRARAVQASRSRFLDVSVFAGFVVDARSSRANSRLCIFLKGEEKFLVSYRVIFFFVFCLFSTLGDDTEKKRNREKQKKNDDVSKEKLKKEERRGGERGREQRMKKR